MIKGSGNILNRLSGDGVINSAVLSGSGFITVPIFIQLGLRGVIVGSSISQATISAIAKITGTSLGSSSLSAIISAITKINGTSIGIAAVSGDLNATAALSGTSIGVATLTGGLKVSASISGTVSGIASTLSDLSGLGFIVGTSAGTTTTSGDLTELVSAGGNPWEILGVDLRLWTETTGNNLDGEDGSYGTVGVGGLIDKSKNLAVQSVVNTSDFTSGLDGWVASGTVASSAGGQTVSGEANCAKIVAGSSASTTLTFAKSGLLSQTAAYRMDFMVYIDDLTNIDQLMVTNLLETTKQFYTLSVGWNTWSKYITGGSNASVQEMRFKFAKSNSTTIAVSGETIAFKTIVTNDITVNQIVQGTVAQTPQISGLSASFGGGDYVFSNGVDEYMHFRPFFGGQTWASDSEGAIFGKVARIGLSDEPIMGLFHTSGDTDRIEIRFTSTGWVVYSPSGGSKTFTQTLGTTWHTFILNCTSTNTDLYVDGSLIGSLGSHLWFSDFSLATTHGRAFRARSGTPYGQIKASSLGISGRAFTAGEISSMETYFATLPV